MPKHITTQLTSAVKDNASVTIAEGERLSARRQAQGAWADLALHTLGWKAFQDLCAQTCEEILRRPVEVFREAQDGGQDAVFVSRAVKGLEARDLATVQCKFTSKATGRLKPSDLTQEESHIRDYLVVSLPSMADEVAKDPSLDLDEDPEYHFESILTVFKELESYFDGDPSAVTVLSDAKDGIDYAIRGVEKKKREKERKTTEQEEEDNWHWEERAPADSASAEIKSVSRGPRGVRSILAMLTNNCVESKIDNRGGSERL
jgi:hypothetical protein